jgi:hypothetical protein
VKKFTDPMIHIDYRLLAAAFLLVLLIVGSAVYVLRNYARWKDNYLLSKVMKRMHESDAGSYSTVVLCSSEAGEGN